MICVILKDPETSHQELSAFIKAAPRLLGSQFQNNVMEIKLPDGNTIQVTRAKKGQASDIQMGLRVNVPPEKRLIQKLANKQKVIVLYGCGSVLLWQVIP